MEANKSAPAVVAAEIEIAATPETVWDVLTDFEHYVALLGTGRCGLATATIEESDGDRIEQALTDPCNGQPRQILYSSLPADNYTLTVVNDSGATLSFDAVIAR